MKRARFFLWIVGMFLSVVTANADGVSVRAGEHAGFTRVVFEFPRRPDWTAGRTQFGYEIHLAGEVEIDPLDIRKAFENIGRDRIAAVDLLDNGTGFRIEIACRCAAEIFTLSDRLIVFDVRDGPPGIWAQYEAPLPHSEATNIAEIDVPSFPNVSQIELLSGTQSSPIEAAKGHEVPSGVPFQHEIISDSVGLYDQPGRQSFIGSQLSEGTPEFDERQPQSAVADLGKEFSRAIAQGLVDPIFPGTFQTEPAAPTNGTETARPNIDARTAIDDFFRPSDGIASASPAPSSCIRNSSIDVAAWALEVPVLGVGSSRSLIIGDNGLVDEEAVLRLSRQYIALGFGAEALAVARLLPDGREKKIIAALGHILDGREGEFEVLSGQLECPGAVAFWALLSKPVRNVDLPKSTDGILETFSGLPKHIRSNLGPLFSDRLRQAGEPEDARIALNAVSRVGGGSRRQDLTASRLGLLGTNADKARTELRRLSKNTDLTAAEALFDLLLDAQNRGVSPEPDWVDDAPSLIRATQGTSVADNLSVAHLRSSIALNRFDFVRRSIFLKVPGVTEQVAKRLAAEALVAAAVTAGDDTFLRSEVGFTLYAAPEDFKAEERVKIASRLLSLGLAERAMAYLAEENSDIDYQKTKARALLSMDMAQEALELTELGQLPDIRAAALDQLLRPKEAASIYADLGETNLAARRALQAGDISGSLKLDAEVISDALGVLSSPTLSSPSDGTLLQIAEEAAARKQAALRLLTETEVSR